MLPSRIVHVLNFFDVCGYRTGSSSLTKYGKIQFLILILHIALLVFFTIHQFQAYVALYPQIGILETLNIVVQYSIELYTYCQIILDSFLNRQQHLCFWEKFQTININFHAQMVFLNGYLCKFIEFSIITNILYVLIYSVKGLPASGPVFCFFILIIICQLRVFYYSFCLDVIHWQLKMIENEFKVVQSSSSTVARLKRINVYYDCVMDMIELLNEIFGWSQITTILCCFYSLLTDLNWLYANFDKFSIAQNSCRYFG